MQPPKVSKPIIISEQIIKPVTDTEDVHVQRVTCKRDYQDIEDIDTFIIQKPIKKKVVNLELDPKLEPPTKKLHSTLPQVNNTNCCIGKVGTLI